MLPNLAWLRFSAERFGAAEGYYRGFWHRSIDIGIYDGGFRAINVRTSGRYDGLLIH